MRGATSAAGHNFRGSATTVVGRKTLLAGSRYIFSYNIPVYENATTRIFVKNELKMIPDKTKNLRTQCVLQLSPATNCLPACRCTYSETNKIKRPRNLPHEYMRVVATKRSKPLKKGTDVDKLELKDIDFRTSRSTLEPSISSPRAVPCRRARRPRRCE